MQGMNLVHQYMRYAGCSIASCSNRHVHIGRCSSQHCRLQRAGQYEVQQQASLSWQQASSQGWQVYSLGRNSQMHAEGQPSVHGWQACSLCHCHPGGYADWLSRADTSGDCCNKGLHHTPGRQVQRGAAGCMMRSEQTRVWQTTAGQLCSNAAYHFGMD